MLASARVVGTAAIAAGVVVEYCLYDVDAGCRAVIFDKVSDYTFFPSTSYHQPTNGPTDNQRRMLILFHSWCLIDPFVLMH